MPLERNNKHDWDKIKMAAKAGKLEDIPSEVYLRYYHNIKKIEKDHIKVDDATDHTKGVWIYGPTGEGKSSGVRKIIPKEEIYLK